MKCKHKWIFDYHYIDNNGYSNRSAETAIYHCEKCGEVKRHPVWIDAYAAKHK
jgi:hypothetical protein